MKNALSLLLLLLAAASFAGTSAISPSTTNNDDSCDIAVQPAATLLLPYFEVDLKNQATTTLFTIQNISPSPRIANVTLWTDWGFPALNFPVHLTGYDVQGVNLYDVLVNGAIPPTACGGAGLSRSFVIDLQLLFTTGKGTGAAVPCTAAVGGVHVNAIGYATVDLVASCAATNATSSDYFANLLFDNVLTGDSQQLFASGGHLYATGGPLVHLRAIPEGGPAGAGIGSGLPYTFYDRFTPDALRRTDRRQPLPALFAPRFINGGTGAFNARLKIWREGITPGTCSGSGLAARSNSDMPVADVVRFDEHENATVAYYVCGALCPPGPPGLPSVSSISSSNTSFFPAFSVSGDVGGWIYLNLDHGRMKGRPSQNWVVVSMFADPTYATETPAPALGNGCSPAVKQKAPIGPAPNVTP